MTRIITFITLLLAGIGSAQATGFSYTNELNLHREFASYYLEAPANAVPALVADMPEDKKLVLTDFLFEYRNATIDLKISTDGCVTVETTLFRWRSIADPRFPLSYHPRTGYVVPAGHALCVVNYGSSPAKVSFTGYQTVVYDGR